MKRLRIITAAAALILLLAACGDDADTTELADDPEVEETPDEPEEVADEPETTEQPDEAADEPAEADVTVATASTDLGEVLVDGAGMTLYIFDNDEAGESTCYDDCEANWPPLVVDDEAGAGEGADAGLLGSTERTDGTTQVTYDGWPLYHWVGDEEPGDTNGQGVGDIWWVVAPDGTPQREGDAEDDSAGPSY